MSIKSNRPPAGRYLEFALPFSFSSIELLPHHISMKTLFESKQVVERVVYVSRDACERPHGLGSCVILGFGDLPRYTGVIVFQEFVEYLPRRYPPTTRHF
jgi:hypothetical protein